MSLQLRGDLHSPRAAPQRKRMKVGFVGIPASAGCSAFVRVGTKAAIVERALLSAFL